MLSSTLWWIWFLKQQLTDSRTLTNMSLSNGSSKFERSFELYLMSVSKTAFLLNKCSNREYLVHACVVTRWVKSTPSITYDQSVRFLSSTFINKFSIVLFCLSTKPFICWWYALVTSWMVPVRRCNLAETLLNITTTFIWIEKKPCLRISSYKSWETVVVFLSLGGFASDKMLK